MENKSKMRTKNNVKRPVRFQFNLFFIFIIFAGMLISLYYFGGGITGFVVLETSSQSNFNQGTYFQTFYDTSGFVQLNETYTTGNYISKIFDASASTQWNNISWIANAGEMLNNQQSDSINMLDNILLMHMNEQSGTISDYSGEANDGTYNGASYSQTGKLGSAIGFDGETDFINISELNALYDSKTWWFKSNPGDSDWRHYANISGTLYVDGEQIANATSNTSCGDLAWGTGSGSAEICGECDAAPLGACSGLVTYSSAVAYCEDVGARLCTNAEIENDETRGTGCGYDNLQTWTTTSCGVNRVITQEGDGDQGDNCVLMNSTAYVRCCADVTVHSRFIDIFTLNNTLIIGDGRKGLLDEVSVWDRSLSADEVKNIYQRGILKLNLSVRTCDDTICSGENWIDLNDTSYQNLSANRVSDNQYFQYKFVFETDNVSYTPKLYNVSIDYTDIIPPNITIISPEDYSSYYTESIEANVSISEVGNCSYSLNNSGYLLMDSINSTYFYKNISNLTEGLHNITFNCTDLSSNSNNSLRHFTISFNPGCSNGFKDQDESDVDCGGICGNNCNDTKTCNNESDCSSGFCENNICVSCSDGINNNNESDIDCGGSFCSACTIGKICSTVSDCSSEASSCSNNICVSCSDGILNQGEDLIDCGGSYCDTCSYLPYFYDDCGNPANETHLIQGTDFTFVGGINSSLSNSEKSVSYYNDEVIYRYSVDNIYDYQVKIKLLQPTDAGRVQNILADSNVLDSSRSVPEYNSLQYTYEIPRSSYTNDSKFDLIFEKVSGANAVCSEIELWKSTSISSSLTETSYVFDFDTATDYNYNSSEIIVENSSTKIYLSVETGLWNTLNKTSFDEGTYNNTLYNETSSALELNLDYNNATYQSKILDSEGNSTWHNITWIQTSPYGQELPNNKEIETKWLSGNANMSGNIFLMHLNEESGTIFDSSGEGNDGTYNGALYNQTGKINSAIGFDGNDDYIDCGNAADEDYDALTISQWVKPTSFNPVRWRTSLHRNDGTSVGSSVFYIGFESGSNQIMATIGAGSGAGYMAGASGITAQVDTWYHVVNSWDGTTARIYVNGIEKNNYALSSAAFNNKVANTKIASSGFGTGYLFNGLIDETSILNRSLSADEVKNIYKRGALKLNLSVRTCDDANCDTETWTNITGTSPQDLSLENNQYFQYKYDFESYNQDYSPQLNNLSVAYLTNNSVDFSIIETNDLVVSDLAKWLNATFIDSGNLSYDYSTDSGNSWSDVPLNANLSNVSVASGKIKFRINLTNDAILYDINVSYYTSSIVNCSDSIKNQDETDVDCGGNTCSKCSNGKLCLDNLDCQSNLCSGGVCQSSGSGNNGNSGGSGGGSSGFIPSGQVLEELNDQEIKTLDGAENFTVNIIDGIFSNETTKVLFDEKIIFLDELPNKILELNNTYIYLEIVVENLSDEVFEETIIKFNVNKSWINNNTFDSVSLYMYYNDTWIKLKTKKYDENNRSIYYNSQTSGFSYFAIVGEKTAELQEEITSEQSEPIKKDEIDLWKWVIFIGIFFLVVVVFIPHNHLF